MCAKKKGKSIRIPDEIAEEMIRHDAWGGIERFKPLYRISEITIGREIIVKRDRWFSQDEREILYGEQYRCWAESQKEEIEYDTNNLPFKIKEWDGRPIGT